MMPNTKGQEVTYETVRIRRVAGRGDRRLSGLRRRRIGADDRPAVRRLAGQQRPRGRHRSEPGRRRSRTSSAARSPRAARGCRGRRSSRSRASSQQIFVRAFKNGQWVTQGRSLNIDPDVEAEAPSIDFAGAGRTVPWDSWYEPNAALGGEKQIFASRFATPPANTWVPEGQDRGSGVPVAEHPHRPGGREPVGRGRRGRARQRPGAVGGVAGAGRQRQRLRQPRPDLRLQGRQAGRAERRRAPASSRRRPASVSAFCWQQVGARPPRARTAARRRPATRR